MALLRKRWYIVLAATVLGGIGAFALSTTLTPVFHSTASLYFSLRTGTSGSDINQGSTYTQNQMLSFARLATSALVLEPVVRELDGELSETQLRRLMDVTIPQNTVILDIRVGSTDPERAALIANTVADSLVSVVDEVAPVDVNGKSTVTARTIEPATAANVQTSPNKQQNALLGAILGLIVSSVVVVLATFLDIRVRSESTLRSITPLPLLGSIERIPKSADARPVAITRPNGRAADSFRQVRSGLRFASASHETRSVAVTSAVPFEGKTTLATNLAFVVAETGARVLLIDADLRTPRVADMFFIDGTAGVTTVLVDAVPFRSVVQSWAGSTLDIIPSGEIPPNPAELLASPRMKKLIQEAVDEYDLVVVDTPSVASAADAAVIARQVDSTLIVVDTTRARRAQLTATLDALERADAHISGVILNRVRSGSRNSHSERDDEANRLTSERRGARANPPAAESVRSVESA
jgi:capsular exopolysaccharide synthesis family protein